MKRLATTATAVMREDIINEAQVLRALLECFDKHGIQNALQYKVTHAGPHKVQYIRSVGLMGFPGLRY